MRNRVSLILICLAVAVGLGLALFGKHTPEPSTAVPVAPEAKALAVPVKFELIRLSREGMGVIAGSAKPGAFVDVMSKGQSIGRSRASDSGGWEIVVGIALAPGTHVLGLNATTGAGQEARSVDMAVIAVPPTDTKPALKAAKGEKKPVAEDGVLAVVLPRQGNAAGRVLQRPGPLTPTTALGIDLADFDAAGRTVLAGRATAGNNVNVYLDGRPVGTVAVGDDGIWNLTVPAVTAAPQSVRLEEIEPGNAVAQTVEQVFNPAITLAVDADNAAAAVLPDKTVWHVVRRQTGGMMRFTQVFRPDQGAAQGNDGADVRVPGILKPGSDF